MDRWATKDHYELETDEAGRLVRPAPKVKPPRRDKRREDTHPDRDPDVDDDPDVAKDKDLSQNYKSIGGRVVAAFLRRLADAELIKVRHRDTGKVVKVKPETLKSKPNEYESLDDPNVDSDIDQQMLGELLSDMPPSKPKSEPKSPPPPSKPPETPKPPPTPKTEVAPPPEKKPEGKKPKNDEFYEDAGRELYEAAKTDLHLQGILKNLRDPKSELAGMAVHAPQLPAAPFLKGKKLPPGIDTLDDLQKAVLHGRHAKPKPPQPEKPAAKPEEPPPKPQDEAKGGDTQPSRVEDAEARLDKAIDRLEQQHKSVPPEFQAELDRVKKELEEARSQIGHAPTVVGKPGEKQPKQDKEDAQAKKIVETFKAQEGEADPEWQAHLDSLPTTSRNADGQAVFIDPKSKREVPFEELPESAKASLISSYQAKRHDDYTTAMLAAMLATKLQGNDKATAYIEGMFDPESDVYQKIASLKEAGHDLDVLPAKKNLPELAEVLPASIKTVGDFQRLIQGHADMFKKKTPRQAWEKDEGPSAEAFQEYAKEAAGATLEDGKLLFKVGKKIVPWDKLDDAMKDKLHEGFERSAKTSQLTESVEQAARQDPDVAYALYQLGNPRSDVAARLARVTDLSDPIIDKALPSLRGLALPPGATMKDVVEIAKKAFKPIPPPIRPEVSPDEQASANFNLKQAFKKYPVLGQRVAGLGLHPNDVSQVLGIYQRAKAMKVKPDDLQGMIDDAHKNGLYTTDPTTILPPKAGLNKNGQKTAWKNLTPEEQSEAYAAHRNEVIGTTMALRDMVNDTFQKLGVPKQFSDTLALARLSRVPGETNTQRALRARPMATRLFDQGLKSNAEPRAVSEDEIKRTLAAIGDDPLTQSLAVAQFQANDYLQAREKFLSQTDEREHPRNIAAHIREASKFLRDADSRYPEEYRTGETPELYRKRVMSRLTALTPEKAAQIQPEIQKLDADDYDKTAEAHETATKKWKKADVDYRKAEAKAQREYDKEVAKVTGPSPYRGRRIKSVIERLADQGIREPIPPRPLRPKPPGYDLVRNPPGGQAQSGSSLWRRLLRGLTASERVVERFRVSSCSPGDAMGTSTPDKQAGVKLGLYWGVDPNDARSKAKEVNIPHRGWEQAQARDLSEADYKSILAKAREWMKVPVLARILDEGTTEGNTLGAVKDIQFRAALDLAIRDMDGGKYSAGLYPTVYNNLLAQLAGKPEGETLLTQRSASGSLYSQTTGEERPMNAAAEIRKFAAEIAAKEPGLAFDLTNLAFRVAEQEGQGQQQEKKEDNKPDFLKDKEAAAKYTAVRGAIIRLAHDNPAVRPALVPVLQLLKG